MEFVCVFPLKLRNIAGVCMCVVLDQLVYNDFIDAHGTNNTVKFKTP
jgi:hypothetical protein